MTGAALSAPQRERLHAYLAELTAWNARLNLTTVPAEQAWDRHVEESLTLLWRMDAVAGLRCVDVGSGGGIPGLVIAVVRPDLPMTLVEADRRKAGFLIHVSGLLELENVTVLARRAEELGRDPDHREHYDVAVSRAAAPPPLLCELSLPLLRVGGRLWALVRDAGAAAPAACAAAAGSGGAAEDAGDGVMLVRKLRPTPGDLPRRRQRRISGVAPRRRDGGGT